MSEAYQQSVEGLTSSDAETLLNSAIWLVENPDEVEEQDFYMKACEVLCTASSQDVECLQYISDKLVNNPVFKTQLFSQVLKDSPDEEIKQGAVNAIEMVIDSVSVLKSTNTDVVAEIYNYIKDTGNATVIEKAKLLL